MDLPLADPRATPVQASEDYYYKIPVRSIFNSYLVYLASVRASPTAEPNSIHPPCTTGKCRTCCRCR